MQSNFGDASHLGGPFGSDFDSLGFCITVHFANRRLSARRQPARKPEVILGPNDEAVIARASPGVWGMPLTAGGRPLAARSLAATAGRSTLYACRLVRRKGYPANHPRSHPPRDEAWSARTFGFRDPSGNGIFVRSDRLRTPEAAARIHRRIRVSAGAHSPRRARLECRTTPQTTTARLFSRKVLSD
jgi:hypothetical protein